MRINTSQKKTVEFIPEWNGNKDLPKEEQVVVLFKNLTNKQRSEVQKEMVSNLSKKEFNDLRKQQGKKNDDVEVDPSFYKKEVDYYEKLMQKFVIGIQNLEDDDGPVDTIKKLEDSFSDELYKLYREINGAFTSFINSGFLPSTS